MTVRNAVAFCISAFAPIPFDLGKSLSGRLQREIEDHTNKKLLLVSRGENEAVTFLHPSSVLSLSGAEIA
jgi:hypothetical protein